MDALQDIMAQNWTSANKRKENSSETLVKASQIIDEERSIVSSIKGDEIEEVQFPEFDIELLSQENVEEGSNNSYNSIVVCEIDIDLADVKANPLQEINDGDNSQISQLENQCPNCCKIIRDGENLE